MEDEPKVAPSLFRGAEICKPGQSWTCTIQCDPGTRFTIERIINAPGAEVCAVSACHCEQVPAPPPWSNAQATGSVQDVAFPLAVVVFGIDQLLRRP